MQHNNKEKIVIFKESLVYNFPLKKRNNEGSIKGEFAKDRISIGRCISENSKRDRGNGRHCDAGRRTTGDNLLIFYHQTAPDCFPLCSSFDTWCSWTMYLYLLCSNKLFFIFGSAPTLDSDWISLIVRSIWRCKQLNELNHF